MRRSEVGLGLARASHAAPWLSLEGPGSDRLPHHSAGGSGAWLAWAPFLAPVCLWLLSRGTDCDGARGPAPRVPVSSVLLEPFTAWGAVWTAPGLEWPVSTCDPAPPPAPASLLCNQRLPPAMCRPFLPSRGPQKPLGGMGVTAYPSSNSACQGQGVSSCGRRAPFVHGHIMTQDDFQGDPIVFSTTHSGGICGGSQHLGMDAVPGVVVPR